MLEFFRETEVMDEMFQAHVPQPEFGIEGIVGMLAEEACTVALAGAAEPVMDGAVQREARLRRSTERRVRSCVASLGLDVSCRIPCRAARNDRARLRSALC